MNSTLPPLEGTPWSTRRFARTVGIAFAGQVIVVWLLLEKPNPAPPPKSFGTSVGITEVWASAPPNTDPLWFDSLPDAALVPLPNLRGFSGSAWLRYAPLDHTLASWEEPGLWLRLNNRDLGSQFRFEVQEHALPILSVADQPIPPRSMDTIAVNALRIPETSSIGLGGDLAKREFVRAPSLPPWPHRDLITNTVIQAVVQQDGLVLSASLLQSSGLAEADDFALRETRTAIFAPASPLSEPGVRTTQAPLAFGLVQFKWRAEVSSETTNAASLLP